MLTAYEFPWEDVFAEEFDTAIAAEVTRSGFTPDEWWKAGRGSGEDEEWWRDQGPDMAAQFGVWYEQSPDTAVWIAPDGRPGIELGLTVKFGAVEVVMFIDLILAMGTALVVWDLKSGRLPKTNEQLGLYACGIELAYGKAWRPKYGAYFMARGVGKDELTYAQPPIPLDAERYSVAYFTEQFRMLDDAITSGVFVASPGEQCRRCGVNYACLAVGGAEANKFRRLDAGSHVLSDVPVDGQVRLANVHGAGGLNW